MSEIRVKDLLQAKALGCLDAEENATFLHLMEEDNEFPWEELGQYQNLVTLMPIVLDLEIPDLEIKNKVLAELPIQTEDDQTEEEVEEETEEELEEENVTDSTETLEIIEDEEIFIEEEDIDAPELLQIDEVEIKKTKTTDGISFKEPVKPELDLNAFKTAKPELAEEQKAKSQRKAVKKKPTGKSSKNYVSKYSRDVKESKAGVNKILTIAGIVIVIILIFLLVMYLGLSSEIDENKKEIERLKQRIGITLDLDESFPSESRIT